MSYQYKVVQLECEYVNFAKYLETEFNSLSKDGWEVFSILDFKPENYVLNENSKKTSYSLITVVLRKDGPMVQLKNDGMVQLKNDGNDSTSNPSTSDEDEDEDEDEEPITSFTGDYGFLSNFYPCNIELDGVIYPTVEHAFQAAKFTDVVSRNYIRDCTSPKQAKRLGRSLPGLRSDWEQVKLDVMKDLLEKKFSDPTLACYLYETGKADLIEDNTWGDRFWGVCRGVGENHLGRLLMEVRDKLP